MLQLFLIAVALSMDAFAASICEGLSEKKKGIARAATVGLFFGGFQALMPVIGFFLGTQFLDYIESADHWIAFGLLALVGINMIREAFEDKSDLKPKKRGQLLLMAIATSIDALAVGIAFAISKEDIWLSATVIGVTAFAFSFTGVLIGKKVGSKFEKGAIISGGIVLILIGLKIVIEHIA